MQDLIRWLQSVEKLAEAIYSEAAARLAEDRKLADFLGKLAEDENHHFELLAHALITCADLDTSPGSAISLDQAARQRVEGPLQEARAMIRTADWAPDELLTVIAKAELSEWNDIFLYVLRTCGKHSKEFQRISAQIQAHEMRIRDFLASRPDGEIHLAQLQGLPTIWRHRILVVEDNDELREIFCHILGLDYETIAIAEGRSALESTSIWHFDAVISDIDMPEMNGLEFFRQALINDPDLEGHLIFITGGINDEAALFARQHKIPILRKPFDLSDLRKAVHMAVSRPLSSGRPANHDNTGDRDLSPRKNPDSN